MWRVILIDVYAGAPHALILLRSERRLVETAAKPARQRMTCRHDKVMAVPIALEK